MWPTLRVLTLLPCAAPQVAVAVKRTLLDAKKKLVRVPLVGAWLNAMHVLQAGQ